MNECQDCLHVRHEVDEVTTISYAYSVAIACIYSSGWLAARQASKAVLSSRKAMLFKTCLIRIRGIRFPSSLAATDRKHSAAG